MLSLTPLFHIRELGAETNVYFRLHFLITPWEAAGYEPGPRQLKSTCAIWREFLVPGFCLTQSGLLAVLGK